MNTEWNLNPLYNGVEDPAYIADMKAMEGMAEELKALVEKAPSLSEIERTEQILLAMEKMNELMGSLGLYIGLRLAVNTEDGDMMAQENKLMAVYNQSAASVSALTKILGSVEDIDALAKESDLVKTYTFFLKENKKDLSHKFSDDVEAMISAMDRTSGGAWSSLQSFLTSTVKVDYEGQQITLSEVRNLAYSDDANVRKKAYEAEIVCYEKIQDSIAFALNNIKNQVTMITEKRGYESPLAYTLEQSKMSRETLEAMMEAVEEYLPVFRKYLRKKGEYLGYKNGLPWYELFAPVGKDEKTYSLEEARDYLVACYKDFAPDLAEMIQEAFDQEWIDFYPRKGKQGGAFCAEAPKIKQSRILTNYDGTFGAVDTLAHELGHAFHNKQVENERPLNRDYPMPVAETASTFNEVRLAAYALKQASDAEKLAILESDLKESTQCIVDIYSRYLFETAVFEQTKDKFLMADDLKQIMLDAQKKAYGDGLDEAYMHPFMWVCKGHYYSSGLSFYNFPYTFGNLFAKGLYSLYLKEGESFVPKYKAMLNATSKQTIEEDGAMMGIDLTKKEFWKDSLQLMADEIEEFCKLVE